MHKSEILEAETASVLYGLMGFSTQYKEVPLVSSVKGGLVLCMDDRNKLHKKLPGGCVPGAFTGLRIIMPGHTADERANEAIRGCFENDLTPTTHGDLSKGALKGCAVRFALIDGRLEGFPLTTTEESQRLIREYKILHRILRGEHTAKKLILNFNERTTIEPGGEFFVIDYWVPIILGARMDQFASLVSQSAKLVLSRNNRLLYIPVFYERTQPLG